MLYLYVVDITEYTMKKLPAKYCISCNTELNSIWGRRSKSKFCSIKCQKNHEHLSYIERWKRGDEDGRKGLVSVSVHIRKYLFEKYDSKCCKCGWGEINQTTKKSPLEINHKDGDWKNNSEENIELLCPNCHSLEPTYKALNKGKGRYTVAGVVNPGNNKKKQTSTPVSFVECTDVK